MRLAVNDANQLGGRAYAGCSTSTKQPQININIYHPMVIQDSVYPARNVFSYLCHNKSYYAQVLKNYTSIIGIPIDIVIRLVRLRYSKFTPHGIPIGCSPYRVP